jgi:hypothetical protein
MKKKNVLGIEEQLAALERREDGLRARMAALREQRRKREEQDREKEQSIIGMAVVAAAALSPEFKLAVAEVALVHISDEKHRQFLADRGWSV